LLQQAEERRTNHNGSDLVQWPDLNLLSSTIGHGDARTTLAHYRHTLLLVAAASAMHRKDLTEF
jgi:hypothetical protein